MFFSKKSVTVLASAVMLMSLSMVMTATVFAQRGTQGPGASPPPGARTWICHFDSNDGQIHRNLVDASQAPVDRGVATEGHDTLATTNDVTGCDQPTTAAPTPTPVPDAPLGPKQVFVVPTLIPSPTPVPLVPEEMPTATPTAMPTLEPTPAPAPEEEATPVPEKPSPDGPGVPEGPLPGCYPGGPEPCGGK